MTVPLDFKKLSIDQRIRLIENIWDSIVDEQQPLALTNVQRQELDRRLKAYRERPDEGVSWEELKAQLEAEA